MTSKTKTVLIVDDDEGMRDTLLAIVRENYDLVEVIMVSAVNEIEVAVQAMKDGAYHYITKEFDYDGLRSLVRNALEHQTLSRQVISLSAQVADQEDREFVLGPSRVMREIVDLAHKVAKLPATILVLGESGTGKGKCCNFVNSDGGRSGSRSHAATSNSVLMN